MTQQEMENFLTVGGKWRDLGEELSNRLSKMSNPFENLKISKTNFCKLDLSNVCTKAGADYQALSFKINEDLEFTQTWYVRLEIDNDH